MYGPTGPSDREDQFLLFAVLLLSTKGHSTEFIDKPNLQPIGAR